ncbi:DUF1214 domain-containing protein [Sphingosinicella terrae]|uniref:DUF1214 domain-containing protein n=1 Tax=Sphingosinicella terrae TaxID=2172047 RepID=UPI000E0DD347|nr:DUF1214 domain-containing protein [Sphingosinicella terrae]
MKSDPAADRLLTGRAWADFCDTIKLAGSRVDEWGDALGDLDRAEWYRFLTRVIRNGFERFVENCEADRPRLRDVCWRQSINVQSPDQDHLLYEFDPPPSEYRISGRLGTNPYFVLTEHTTRHVADPGARDWAPLGTAALDVFDPTIRATRSFLQSDALQCDADGNFEIVLSTREHEGNWLQLHPDSLGIMFRIVYLDRASERPPEFRIERIDGAGPAALDPASLAHGLAKTALNVLGYSEMQRGWYLENLKQRPNQLPFSRQHYLAYGGVPDRHFAFGVWDKPPGQALVLRFTPPECEYWNFQLCNVWKENLDNYEERQGYLTKLGARHEADGSVHLVIADRNPGIGGNWIDCDGHGGGVMGLRFIKAEAPPEVIVHLVDAQALARHGWAALAEENAIRTGALVE